MNDALVTDTAALHRSLLTLDSHIDIPWPDGPDPFTETRRCVDLPKMRRGGVGCGFFVAYVPQARRTPETEQAAFDRAVASNRPALLDLRVDAAQISPTFRLPGR